MNKTDYSIPAPQSNGFLPGVGSPQQAAMTAGLQKANLLNDLNKAGSRGGKNRYRGGATDRIPISVPVPMYANANGGQGVTNQTIQNAQNAGQLGVNNQFYSKVSPPTPIPPGQLKPMNGGYSYGSKRKRIGNKREKKAGTRIMGPNTTWGCYSGGKKRKTKRQTIKRQTIKRRPTKRRSTKRKYG